MPELPTANTLAAQVKSIPTLPAVLTVLSRRMEDPNTSAEDLAQVIIQDQAIASKVLKLVNSPFYGFSGRIQSISQGIVMLGFNAVKNLVLSTSVIDAFRGAASGELFRMDMLWVHSASVASTAKLLAERNRICDPEDAFVGGLLHDIGKVLLWTSEPRLFEGCLQLVASKRIPLADVEMRTLGFPDQELAAILAEKWKFPEALVTGLRWRGAPARAGRWQGLASTIHCANILCTAMDTPAHPGSMLTVPEPAAWKLCGLDADATLREVVRELPSRMASAKSFVSSAL